MQPNRPVVSTVQGDSGEISLFGDEEGKSEEEVVLGEDFKDEDNDSDESDYKEESFLLPVNQYSDN